MTALSALHASAGLVLLLAHALFFVRALEMRRRGGTPGPVDRVARTLSHWGLPAAVATGAVAAARNPGGAGGTGLGIVHIALGLMPVVVILAFAPLLPLKRRIPWLLPALNLVLFALAAATGLWLRSRGG